jgi:hypothetical protein
MNPLTITVICILALAGIIDLAWVYVELFKKHGKDLCI